MKSNKHKVIKIATSELRTCYTEKGIIAGTHHFTDFWARDGYFAAFGSLTIGDHEIIKNMLNLFYKYQRDDGLIPYRIMQGPISLSKYMGRPSFFPTPRPTYKLRGFGNKVLDGTTLSVLFTSLLALKGKQGMDKFTPKIKRALVYLSGREKNELLWDGVMAEWNDTAFKWGNLLYSNVIYWYMYDRLTNWTQKTDKKWHKILNSKKESLEKAIYQKLWNGKYFADWYDYKRQDYFYPFGNCLAVAWGLTNKKESESILKKCEEIKINFTLDNNSPKYPFWRIDPLQTALGMGDYQNKSVLWWQPITSYLSALKKLNRQKEIKKIEKGIIKKVLKDGTIYECYERNGKPVERSLYKSEHPFAWASGMVLWSLL